MGEIATLEWQRQTAALLSLSQHDILDTYGSIEIGTIAAFSHEHGRYIIADGIYAEGIGTEQLPEGFEPLHDNEQVLVLTSFVRSRFPAVRYVTYDVVRDFQSELVDGVRKQSFSSIVKRIGPELKHGEKISLYDIDEVVYRFLDHAETRVTLQNNMLTVHIRSKSLTDAMLPLIQAAITDKIPDIGAMIRNRLLSAVRVTADDTPFEHKSVKAKKLYY